MSLTENLSEALGISGDLVGRVATTLVAIALFVALGFLPLPGVDAERAAAVFGLELAPITAGTLGLNPFLVGFVLAELVFVILPGKSSERVFESDRSGSLSRAGILFGLAVTLVQAGAVSWYWFVELPAEMGAVQPILANTGPLATVTAGVSLLAGVALSVLLAFWIQERGLGDGFVVLIGVGMLWKAVPAAETFKNWLRGMNMQNLDVFGVLGNIFAVAAVILGTLWVVTRYERWVVGEGKPLERDGPDRSASTPFHTPAAGILPFAIGSGLLWSFWTARSIWSLDPVQWFGQSLEFGSYGGSVMYLVQELVLVLGLAWACGVLFSRADAAFSSMAEEELESAQRRGTIVSMLYLAGLVVLDVYGGALLGAFGVLNVVMLTVIAVDLRREWLFRRAFPDSTRVERIHRSGAVGPVLDRLGEADVPAFARARCFRGMLRWFGAYAPIDIYVPERCREDAAAALEDAGDDG